MKFVHLHVHSLLSFLDGASKTEQLLETAACFDMPAMAVTDHNNLCAAVEFSCLAAEYGLKPIIGAEITLENSHHLVLLAKPCRVQESKPHPDGKPPQQSPS